MERSSMIRQYSRASVMSPKRRIASARADSVVRPRATISATRISTWNPNSSSMSRLTRERLRHGRRIQRRRPRSAGIGGASDRLEDAEDRRRVLAPRRGLGAKLLAAAGREAVELRLPIVLAHAPLGFDGPGALEAVERLVEGGILDLEHAARALLDPPRDPIPVHGSPRERLEYEDVERPVQEVDWV